MIGGSRTTVTSRWDRLGSTAVLWVLAILTLLPLAVILITAVTPACQLVGGVQIPHHPTLQNFADAWTNGQLASHLIVSARSRRPRS